MENANTTHSQNANPVKLDETTTPSTYRFGWGRITPNALQCFNSPKWFATFAFIATMIAIW